MRTSTLAKRDTRGIAKKLQVVLTLKCMHYATSTVEEERAKRTFNGENHEWHRRQGKKKKY
jgi:hypothetical protein